MAALRALVIGIGVDAVEIERFRTSLARRSGLAARLFTPGELEYAARRTDPTERLAARFAAKEAVMKALGVGIGAVRFVDIEIARADSGVPSLVLHGTAATLARERGVHRWHLSLTHTAVSAHAIVMAEAAPPRRYPGSGGDES